MCIRNYGTNSDSISFQQHYKLEASLGEGIYKLKFYHFQDPFSLGLKDEGGASKILQQDNNNY